MTKIVSLIGYPLKHSISPLFQQSAFDHCQLDIHYQAWETEPAQLSQVINHLRSPSVLGANVTIPFKQAVLPLLDRLDELAERIGAVNTIVNQGGKLIGYNSDAAGFLRALKEDGEFECRGKRAALLGAGGAARAAGFALLEAGVAALLIINRTLERAQTLAAALRGVAGRRGECPSIIVMPWEERGLKEALSSCHLLVNCTPLGMKHSPMEKESPLGRELISGDALVYDLVYNPERTPLLEEAERAGARTLGGLAMLVYQGAISFELWTGEKAPVSLMFEVARQAVRE